MPPGGSPDDLFLMRNRIREIFGRAIPLTFRTDCTSLFDHVYLQKAVSEKCVLIELAIIRDAINCAEITNIEWVPTNAQLANALTKAGYNYKFSKAPTNALLPQ